MCFAMIFLTLIEQMISMDRVRKSATKITPEVIFSHPLSFYHPNSFCYLNYSRYFMQCDPHQHMSLGGKVLDHELRNFQRICSMNRKSLLVKHLIDGDKRQAIGIQPVYVTTEERSVAEYIGNSTKEEIVRRADEKLQLLSDEEVKSDLMKKLADFKRQIARIKKDTLLALYEEITEELNNADVLEMVCQSVEIEEDGD